MPQVLVRVMSAGLDRCDLLSVSGWGRVERGKPYGGFTLGRDFCGVVLEAGRGVEHLHPGDKVWGATPYHAPGTVKNLGTWSSSAVYVSCMMASSPRHILCFGLHSESIIERKVLHSEVSGE